MGDTRMMASVGVFWEHRILLLQRGSEDSYPLLWTLPGGKVEMGEKVPDAAIRELREEAGIEAVNVQLSWVAAYQVERGKGQVSAYILVLDEQPKVMLEPGFAGYGWFTMDECQGLGKLGQGPNVCWAAYIHDQLLLGPGFRKMQDDGGDL